MKSVVLAGGRGVRLWPLSRTKFPKQFLEIDGDSSLLQQTAERLLGVLAPSDLVVMTNEEYRFHVRDHLSGILGMSVMDRVVLEPCSRNTAPALALAARFCLDRLGATSEEVLFVAPADHIIRPADRFAAYVRRAEEIAAQGYLVTFGIPPTAPETGYGYICAGESLAADVRRVERFAEKPDRATAEGYLASGEYLWNSGMFAFRIGDLLDELRTNCPAVYEIAARGYDRALASFAEMPSISIDYAVMEHSKRVVTIPVDLYWNDVGSWDALFAARERDENGNVRIGNVVDVDTHDALILADGRLVTTIGLANVLVVETPDAVLVAQRGDTEKVRQVVEKLAAAGRPEVDEHLTTHRPWGRYTVLGRGDRYQIKRVVVNPGQQLSLQLHHHRSEHWVVVRGTARVVVDGTETFVHENESMYIPKSTRHLLANPGKVPLELIEVQNGEYVGEDDIVRFDDIYGRGTR